MIPRPPKFILILCAVLSVLALLVALTASGLSILEITRTPKLNQLWFLAVFEVLASASALVGLFCAVNRFASAPALAMTCVSMPLIVGGMLGEPSLSARLLGQPVDPMVLSGVQVKWLALAQVGCGVGLLGLASLAVFLRSPARSFAYLARFALACVGLAACAVALRRGPIASGAWSPFVTIALKLLIFFVIVGLVSAAGHCLIRAYESGRPRDADDPGGSGAAGTPKSA